MWNHYRLPKTIIPLNYNIHLKPLINISKLIGIINIKVYNKQITKNIVLHGRNIEINKVLIIGQDDKEYKINNIKYNNDLEYIYLLSSNEIDIGELNIYIEYEGIINDNLYGCYKSQYNEKNGNKKWIIATQLESIYARWIMPCFDEPQLKASFTLILDIDKNLTAYSNMPRINRINIDNKFDRVFFDNSPDMSTYTFAFVIGDYNSLISVYRPMAVVVPPDSVNNAVFGLYVGYNSIKSYENLLNIKFTLPKIDLIVIPESSAGAMENWGLLTFRPSLILTYNNYSSELDKGNVAQTVAHELAHQFFGNLCTAEWWDCIWLNEGIATYFEYIGVNNSFPKWKIWDTFIFRAQQIALETDKLISSHPLNNVLINNDEISEMFDDITYNKGGSILYMIEHIIGSERFYNGLHEYLNKCSYGNGTSKLLLDSLCGNLSSKMKTWTDQAGFPLITITESKNGIKLKQERYLLNYEKINSQKWWISTIIGCSDGSQIKVEFDTEESDFISLDTTWYKINLNQTTFMRVNYPINTWQRIVENKNLSIKDRGGLLNDALNLALDGKLPIDTALDITYIILSKEREYVVWKSGLNYLYKLGDLFVDHECWPYFQKYMINLINKTSDWIWNDNLDHTQILCRASILSLAIYFDEPNISEYCNKIFLQGLPDLSNIPTDLQNSIFSNAVRTMGEFSYKIIFKLYLNESNNIQKNRYLFSLAASKSPELLTHLLNISIDTSIVSLQNRFDIVILVGINPYGRNLAWEFIKNHWYLFNIRGQSIRNLLEIVVGSFYTNDKYNDAKKFLESHKNVAKNATIRSLEKIKYNIKWKELYINNACEWLKFFTP